MAGCRKLDVSDKLIDADNVMKELPPRLVSCLMPFQKEGILFAIQKEGRCLIADEMGLGKTVQAIAVAWYYRDEWPLLIVVPSSLRYVWIEELEKWLPDILPNDINLIQGGFDTAGITNAKITIITYGLLSCKSSIHVKELLKARQFNIAICDESHYFKNSKTECCKAVSPLLANTKRCLLLSGTPALAKPAELFTQMDALFPGKFGSYWSFTKKYCDAHWQHFGQRRQWRADGASNLEELQQRLQKIMIRREKEVVLTQLPPKQRQKILFPLKDSQTKKEILKTYAELKPLLRQSQSALTNDLLEFNHAQAIDNRPEGATEKKDTNILSRIQRLYNLTADAKIGPAREYVQMLCENASLKFLVFAYHHTMMNGLQQTLYDKKVKFVRIDGSTKPSERQLYVQQFQNDKDTKVAILSILAAGVGLTLTAASLVVFAELYWTPGVMVQCEDRAHRIGQKSAIPVHYLVAKETMDEWVWSAVCKKTLVTTALTGKTQALQACDGDSYQVKLLSAAEAYVPVDNSEVDVVQLVASQLPQDQKSILDFFSSQNMHDNNLSLNSIDHGVSFNNEYNSSNAMLHSSKQKDTTCSFGFTPSPKMTVSRLRPLKTARHSTPLKSPLNHSIVIDSSSDEEDNRTKNLNAEMSSEQSVRCSHKAASPEILGTNKMCTTLKTAGRDQKATKVCARKRKLYGSDSLLDSSDESEFEESFTRCTNSKSKKIKSSLSSVLSKSSSFSKTTRIRKNDRAFKNKPSVKKSLEVTRKYNLSQTIGDPSTSQTDIKVLGDRSLTVSSSDSLKNWPCSVCTFVNSALLPYCEMCENSQKTKETEGSEINRTPRKCSKDLMTNFQKASRSTSQNIQSLDDGTTETNKAYVKSSIQIHSQASEMTRTDHDSDSDFLKSVSKKTHCSQQKSDSSGSQSERDSISLYSFVSKSGQVLPTSVKANWRDKALKACELSTLDSLSGYSNCDLENESSREMVGLCDSDTDDLSANKKNVSLIKAKRKSCFQLEVESKKKDIPAEFCVELTDLCAKDKMLTKSGSFLATPQKTEMPQKRKIERPESPTKEERKTATADCSVTSNSISVSDGEIEKAKLLLVTTPMTKQDSHSEKSATGRNLTECAEFEFRTVRNVSVAGIPDSIPGDGLPSQEGDNVHRNFQFSCSVYTGRIYIFDECGKSLGANFLPIDVELDNADQLPGLLHQPHHLRLVQNFIRQWNSLTSTKQRLICKRGLIFCNPLTAYDLVRTDLTNNKQRLMTKEDQTLHALRTAQEVQGTVRVLSRAGSKAVRPNPTQTTSEGNRGSPSGTMRDGAAKQWLQGYVQVLSKDGIPLCLHCQRACDTQVSKNLTSDNTAWHTRFCSRVCADAHWMKTNSAYIRQSVYEIQHGICQLCGFDARTFFCEIRDCSDMKQRASKINQSKFSKLAAGQKKQMIARPYEGLFWHADHIRPVWEGGGQCDVDNLRTLCTPCHLSITSKQASKRAHAQRLSAAACSGDITAFFKKS